MAVLLGEAIARLVLDASGFTKELRASSDSLESFRSRSYAIAQGLSTVGKIFTGVGLGIGASLTAAVKVAADFEESMRNVASISPEVAANMDEMAKGVLRISTETARMPTDLADGLYDIISAAVPAGEALDVLEASAKAANAGLTSTAVAARLTVSILNSGIKDLQGNALTLDKAMDISFQAVNRGVFTYEELASQIGDVLPMAASLGVSYEEVAAAAATMTQNGVSLAETTTQLNAIFTAFLKPTDEVTKNFQAMGYESGQALLEQEGFTRAIELVNEQLEKTGDNTSDFSKNIRAIRGFLGLTNDEMERYNENLEFMENSTGATNKALEQQSKTLNYALRQLKANLAALGVSVGTIFLPAVTALTKALAALVKLIQEIPAPIKAVLGVLAVIAAGSFLLAGAFALMQAAVFRIGTAFVFMRMAGIGMVNPLKLISSLLNPLAALFSGLALPVRALIAPLALVGAGLALVTRQAVSFSGIFSKLSGVVRIALSPLLLFSKAIASIGRGVLLFNRSIAPTIGIVAGIGAAFARLGSLRIVANFFSPLVDALALFGIRIAAIGRPIAIFASTISAAVFRLLHISTIMTLITTPFSVLVKTLGVLRFAIAPVIGALGIVGTLIGAILSPVLAVAGALGVMAAGFAALAAVAVAVVIGFATWSKIADSVHNVVDQFKNLLGLKQDLLDFFDFQSDTKQVEDNTKALTKNRKTFRDRIAEALGVEKHKGASDSFFGGGPDATLFDPSRTGDTKYLKSLDKVLKTTGKEFRAWSNKVKIGSRAVGDFFDIIKGEGQKGELKTFRARLNDVFGEDAGGKIYNATKKIRSGVADLNRELSQRIGVSNVLSLQGATLLALEGFNRLSSFVRGTVVPVFGNLIGTVLDIGAGFVNLGAQIVEGDFSGALDALADIISTTVGGVVIPLAQVTLRVVNWAIQGGIDLYERLKKYVFGLVGGSGTETTADPGTGASLYTQSAESIPIGTVAVAVGGWFIDQVDNLYDKLREKILEWAFGSAGGGVSPGGGTSGEAVTGTGADHDLGTIAVKVAGWLLNQVVTLADALSSKIVDDWGPAAIEIAKSAILGLGEITVDFAGFVVNTVTPKVVGWVEGGIDALRQLIAQQLGLAGASATGSIGSQQQGPGGGGSSTADTNIGTFSNWTFTIGEPAQPPAPKSGFLQNIYNAIANSILFQPIVFDESKLSGSNDLGQRFGEAFTNFFVKVLGAQLGGDNKSGVQLLQSLGWGEGGAGGGADAAKSVGIDAIIQEFVKGFATSVFETASTELTKALVGDDIWKTMNANEAGGTNGPSQHALFWKGLWENIVKPFFTDFSAFEIESDSPLGKSIDWVKSLKPLYDEVVTGISGALFGEGSLFGDMGELWGAIFDSPDNRPMETKSTGIPILDGVIGQLTMPTTSTEADSTGLVEKVRGFIESTITGLDWSTDMWGTLFTKDFWSDKLSGAGEAIFAGLQAALPGIFEGGGIKSSTSNQMSLSDIGLFGEDNIVSDINYFDASIFDSVVQPLIDAIVAVPGKVIEGVGDLDWSGLGSKVLDGIKGVITDGLPGWAQDIIGLITGEFENPGTIQETPGGSDEGGREMPGSTVPEAPIDDEQNVDYNIEGLNYVVGDIGFTWNGKKYGSIGEILQASMNQLGGDSGGDAEAGARAGEAAGGGVQSQIDSLVQSIGQGMSNALSAVATYSQAIYTVASTNFGLLVSNIGTLMSVIPTTIGQPFSDALSAASIYTSAIYTVASTNIGLLVGNVTLLLGAMVTSSVEQFTAMSDGGSTASNNLYVAVSTNMGTMSGNVQAIVSGMAGSVVDILNGLASSGAAAAYNAGMSIGAGLANGMTAMQGQVDAAATALANSAQKAANAALAVASPSKVFHKIGVFVGRGLANGMDDTNRLVSRAGEALAKSTIPTLPGTQSPTIITRGETKKSKDDRANVNFSGATFVVPNLDTAAQIEAYFLNMSR